MADRAVSEIEAGRETDAMVAEVVFGWKLTDDPVTIGESVIGKHDPVVFCSKGGDLCLAAAGHRSGKWHVTEDDGTAWRYLWPKIVEKVGSGVALIWDRDKDAMEVGDDQTPGFRLVTGSNYWSAFEVDTHGGLDIEAPTLALCLTRAALALYGGNDE